MTVAAAAELALRSSVLLGLAWLAAWIIQSQRGSAAMRHAVWMLGFAAVASLPLLAWLLPPLRLAVLPAEPVAPMLPVAATAALAVEPGPSSPNLLALIYLAVALVLLARLAIGRARLEQMWRKAAPADGLRFETARLCSMLGIARPVEVRVAAEAIVPMTWGSIAPRILLPREAAGWSAGRRHSVLLHELGHVSRHDSLGTLIAHAGTRPWARATMPRP
jgi:beta-lactamase regulating signal transducer with metallopeptidase domain